MTEKEYLSVIEQLDSNISVETVKAMRQQLDELYKIKPVRLPWIVMKARAEAVAGTKNSSIFNLMAGKAWYLYDYPGVDKYAALYSWMNSRYHDISDSTRNRIQPWISIPKLQEQHKDELHEIYADLQKRKDTFLDDDSSDEALPKLQEGYFITADYVSYLLVSCLLKKQNVAYTRRNFVENIPNFVYLKERVFSEEDETFILVATEENMTDCEVAATVLSAFDKMVYMLVQPVDCPVEYAVDMTQTVAISMENALECDGVQVITPLEIVLDGSVIGDNRAEIIEYLAQECSEKGLATILASGKLMDDLCEKSLLQKRMERLDNFVADGLERNLSFGWVGNYMTYISRIYDFDTEAAINAPAECDFSIVIPARNSAYSLRHTLQTCLEINYDGSYEIVISDNSTNGSQEVYNLVCELNDDRIKYYKTPRDLHLPKSFEFAFLKARGEFIFSIGSDDGVLPWCLNVLKDVLSRYPDEEIVRWDRGFYAWPGFNGGQQHQFVVPNDYQINQWKIHKVDTKDLLAGVLKNTSVMYALPTLYINSGFRRSYLKTLLEKTGRLWDGICQDIYMGVINIAINPEVLAVEYPLTIAGMTNASIGKISNAAATQVSEAQNVMEFYKKSSNVGGFSLSRIERLMPDLKSDISSLYNSILRAIARGVFPKEYLEILDWKQMYINCISLMDKADLFFDKHVHYMRYTATKHGEEFLHWFDDSVYPLLMKPELQESDDSQPETVTRTYQTGRQKSGGFVLDASEYGVENIYDAVKLFEKVLGRGMDFGVEY